MLSGRLPPLSGRGRVFCAPPAAEGKPTRIASRTRKQSPLVFPPPPPFFSPAIFVGPACNGKAFCKVPGDDISQGNALSPPLLPLSAPMARKIDCWLSPFLPLLPFSPSGRGQSRAGVFFFLPPFPLSSSWLDGPGPGESPSKRPFFSSSGRPPLPGQKQGPTLICAQSPPLPFFFFWPAATARQEGSGGSSSFPLRTFKWA